MLALIRSLDPARVRPALVLLDGTDAESRALAPTGCPVLPLGVASFARPGRLTVAAGRFVRFLRRQRTDVVQTYFPDSTSFAAPLARLGGARAVVRVRNNLGYAVTPRQRRVGRLLRQFVTLTLTNSDAGRDALVAEGNRPERIAVIENGVDLDRFAGLRPADPKRRDPVVGCVANLRPVKNLDGLVRAAVLVRREHPGVRFVVAGEGEERPRLEALIRESGLGEAFRLVGPVAHVPAFLGGIDIGVLPSHTESLSNALLEMLAAGRPAVATEVGTARRVLLEGSAGLLVPPGDDAALAGGICACLRDGDLCKRLVAAAKARAEDFGRAACVRRFEALYHRLIRNRVVFP